MFWKREKTVRIEFLSPPVMVSATAPLSVGETKPQGHGLLSVEQFLKLATIMVAVVNTASVVLGYMRYVGVLQQYGISRTEVAFTLSDLLSFGYVGFLNMTLSGQVAVAAVSTAICLPVMAVVIRLKKSMHQLLQFLLVWGISTGLFFLVTAPYWVGYNPGKEAALRMAAKSLKVEEDDLKGLSIEQEVSTDTGSLTGTILLAMPEITYLLKEDVLYKIRASDGHVLRRTHLKPDLRSASPKE
ncbi:hypothetical protein ABKS89_11540 [Pseudomonas sp. LABIM340]|uniref:hypothetical protein n=1 Tax=Pseudomonas sp. LABIM340 TaxID=3156585 RepID=UPI0032AEC427